MTGRVLEQWDADPRVRSESAGCDRLNSSAALLKLAWSNIARKARRSSNSKVMLMPHR
jgi:hypothetical protein